MSGGRWQAWRVLGIERTADRDAIRRAYADRLRAMDPDADPNAYQDLRDARDAALAWAKEAEGAPSEGPADPALAPQEGDARPGLQDLPIAAPLIDRDVAAPVTAGPLSPPPVLRIAGGTSDSGGGEDIALPTTGSFATPIIDRPAEAKPVTILTNDAVVGAYDLYRDILLPGGELAGYALSDDERMAAMRAIDRFMLDPRLEQLEFRDHASQWVAAVAADAIPRSDPLLYRLAQLLGWRTLAGTLNEPAAIARINERLDAMDFVAAVSTPGHELHRAWRELTTPATERSRRGFVRRSKVTELLNEVRQKHPEAEGWFDTYRVGLWENAVQGPGSSWWIIMLLIGLIRLATFALSPSEERQPPVAVVGQPVPTTAYSPPLSNMAQDLTGALARIDAGVDADDVERSNKAVLDDLTRDWARLKAKGATVADFDKAIGDYFNSERLSRAKAAAPVALARKLVRNSIEQIDYIRLNHGADVCARWIGAIPGDTPLPSEALRKARRHLLIRAVLSTPPSELPPSPPKDMMIPGTVIEDMIRRLGWTPERIGRALAFSASTADICQASITVREAALTRAKQNARLLRFL